MSQSFESIVRNIALAQIQWFQPGARYGQCIDGLIADGFATPHVQIAQFVAMLDDVFDAAIGNPIAFGHWQVPQIRAQLGKLI